MVAETAAASDQQDSRYLSTASDITRCLTALRDHRTELTLRIPGETQTIRARVLDLDKDGFLIEDINPRSALALLRKKPYFSVSARAQGSFAFIERAQIVEEGAERGLPYFRIPLPKNMLFQQRRRAARFRLPSRVTTAGANLTLMRQHPVAGRLQDVSAGGCRAAFKPPLLEDIRIEEKINDCTLALPPSLKIHTEGIVRHVHQRKDGLIICGIEFTQMSVTDRRRLEQFIRSLSRSAERA